MAKGSSKPKDSTSELVARARRGDRVAGDEVAGREMAKLRRWARGKLPRFARDIRDTEDVVQDAMLRTFSRIDRLDVSKPGGLQSYARKTFKNSVIDRVRSASRRPLAGELPDVVDGRATPEAQLEARESAARLRAALARLSPTDRALISARVDRDWPYDKIARALKKPSADAARVAVYRACRRLLAVLRQ